MTRWRRFERQEATLEYWEIRQEGIRCFLRWGSDRTPGKASTTILDDEEQARRHAVRKINDRLRKGFTEVESPCDPAEAEAGTPVLDVITRAAGTYAPVPEFLPVDGFDQVFRCARTPDHPMGFFEYYVLREQGRSAVRFAVRAGSHQDAVVAGFLDFLCSRRDLAFDGRSHHKVALPSPVGSFDHALFCSPALGRACAAYPAAAARVATAFPIFNCEIGDEDPEVLVDARIHGHASLPYSDWGRSPYPAVDLRFDIQPSLYRPSPKFKIYRPSDVQKLLDVLPTASPQSWLEVRSFRGETACLQPDTTMSFTDVLSLLID
ncbi:WGR domain-containing protein [Kitasatospora sp. DSM 101779]|uniref:WGR domain-containing protein n=1 Tax=Kitasatospora sp. DSM 101779 TaxID=2853165 RepID=UPI0021D9AE94|nr:WGR domain-containing protein [Kitasatospora sp. DSM 101779]MCU7820254.1 WGR domain-containing protein [Kitasatospora sp. DSM 101779]